jgi:hypothetical protein
MVNLNYLEMDIQYLPFNCPGNIKARAVNVLKNEGINKIKDLTKLNIENLLRLPNCGRKTTSVIANLIEKYVKENIEINGIGKNIITLNSNLSLKQLLTRLSLIENIDLSTLSKLSKLYNYDPDNFKCLIMNLEEKGYKNDKA